MKPTKCPAKGKKRGKKGKRRKTKRIKKRGGKKARRKSQDYCVTFRPKNYLRSQYFASGTEDRKQYDL